MENTKLTSRWGEASVRQRNTEKKKKSFIDFHLSFSAAAIHFTNFTADAHDENFSIRSSLFTALSVERSLFKRVDTTHKMTTRLDSTIHRTNVNSAHYLDK